MKNIIRQVLKEYTFLIEQDEDLKKYAANTEPPILSNLKKSLDEVITGSYTAAGQPRAYDALHSFHKRASDGFGGRINSIVKDGIKEYKINTGIKKVDIKKVYVTINPSTLKVNWEVTIGPSTDGYTYEEFDSRGSAGGGEGAVNGQLESMKSYHPNKVAKLVYHYNQTIPKCFNPNGTKMEGGCKGTINIQQKFFKFGKKI